MDLKPHIEFMERQKRNRMKSIGQNGKAQKSGLPIIQRIGLWLLTKKINSIADNMKGGDTVTTPIPVSTEASKRFALNWTDLKKIGISFGLAVLGVTATFLQDTIPNVDFGVYSPVVAGINMVAINAIRKFLQSYGSVV